MKISRHWLSNFFADKMPVAQALADALTFHAFEIDGIVTTGDPLNAETSDDILDVKVTPNRGHDCLSYRGIAGELSAILRLPLKADPWADIPNFSKVTDRVSVTIEDPALAPRYIAAYITGVKVGPSPAWLVQALEAMGQRSINNVVDATNYVMFNTGQPLHAFDAGKLAQKDGRYHIVVRNALPGEKILALDNKEYALKDSMLVIADGTANVPIGIAGIKGGTPAGITEATQDIIVESANFNGVSVRKTAAALKLRTDASSRFEQVISPELASRGMKQVVDLIVSLAGADVVGYSDVYPAPQERRRVAVSVDTVNQTLGTRLTGAEVADVFQRLQFAYKEESGLYDVEVPFQRLDITIAEDLVEEVGRIVGYDKVPAEPLPPMPAQPEVNLNFYTAERVRKQLTDMGYSEIFTSVFADKGGTAVLNKVDSVKPYLRANLTDGLTDALKKNIPNKDLLGLKEVKLFEIGSIWKDGKEEVSAGIVTEKEKAQEEPLSMHAPKEIPTQYEDLPLSATSRYQTFSKYPYIVRDIAMWLPENIKDIDSVCFSGLIDPVMENSNLNIKVDFLDRFQKGDKTSVAFRLVFQSFERTLTEAEVNQIMEKVSASLKEKGFEIR